MMNFGANYTDRTISFYIRTATIPHLYWAVPDGSHKEYCPNLRDILVSDKHRSRFNICAPGRDKGEIMLPNDRIIITYNSRVMDYSTLRIDTSVTVDDIDTNRNFHMTTLEEFLMGYIKMNLRPGGSISLMKQNTNEGFDNGGDGEIWELV